MNKIETLLKSDNSDEISELLKSHKENLLSLRGKNQENLSHLAVYAGNSKLVYELLAHEMFVDEPDQNGYYPYMYTVKFYKDFYQDFSNKDKQKAYDNILEIGRMLKSSKKNTFFTKLTQEDTVTLVKGLLKEQSELNILKSDSSFGDIGIKALLKNSANSKLLSLAVQSGDINLIVAICASQNKTLNELLDSKTQYLIEIHTPYLLPYLDYDNDKLLSLYDDILAKREEYNNNKAALIIAIERNRPETIKRIFSNISPFQSTDDTLFSQDLPIIAYIMNTNNIEAFKIAMDYIDDISQSFYENDIPKTILMKALEKDKESGENIYSQIIAKYYPDILQDISMEL